MRQWLWIGLAIVFLSVFMSRDASPLIQKIAHAIAMAEGFFITGSRPQRNHNPGDLTQDLTGTGIGKDGQFIVYASDTDGWDALYTQIQKILSNMSAYYRSDMSIMEIAQIYSPDGWQDWALNVAVALGVDPNTPLDQVV